MNPPRPHRLHCDSSDFISYPPRTSYNSDCRRQRATKHQQDGIFFLEIMSGMHLSKWRTISFFFSSLQLLQKSLGGVHSNSPCVRVYNAIPDNYTEHASLEPRQSCIILNPSNLGQSFWVWDSKDIHLQLMESVVALLIIIHSLCGYPGYNCISKTKWSLHYTQSRDPQFKVYC